MIDLNAPLSESELDYLSDFLDRNNCMHISALDGFLTAIVSSPEILQPGEWLAAIVGDGDNAVKCQSDEEAHNVLEYIIRHLNSTRIILSETPDDFRAILLEAPDPVTGEERIFADEWCWGYITAVEIYSELWRPLMENTKNLMLILPILALAHDEDSEIAEFLASPENELMMLEALPECVNSIYDFWHSKRKRGGKKPEGAKVGRNDPCPCGSGKKYKKCHGASELQQ